MLTACTLALTAALTATRLEGTGVLDALRRDPGGLLSGELWRFITPVLVQSDRSTLVVVGVFVLCAVVGTVGELVFSTGQWITLYVIGALVGHGIGEVFQPHQSGTSVAFAAILGGLAASVLDPNVRVPRVWRIEAIVLTVAALLDTVLADIHGLPFLAGLVIATVWVRHGSVRLANTSSLPGAAPRQRRSG